MLNVESILKSFTQPEDKLFIKKVLDQASLCFKNHVHTFTDFMDMHQYEQVMKLITEFPSDLSYEIFGGYTDAERKILGFTPFYLPLEKNHFPIQIVKIKNCSVTHHLLSHRDYLGAMIKSGIDRDKIGDILVTNSEAIIFLDTKISDYIQMNINKIGRCTVEMTPLSLENLVIPSPKTKEIQASVASLRADALLSSGFSISRSKAVGYIKGQKVFKNWIPVKSPSENVEINDILTLRGKGRIKLVNIGNKTRKNRISITIHWYV